MTLRCMSFNHCVLHIFGSSHEFAATLFKYTAMLVSTVDFGEFFSLRPFHFAVKPALRPDVTFSDMNIQVLTTLRLKKMLLLVCA